MATDQRHHYAHQRTWSSPSPDFGIYRARGTSARVLCRLDRRGKRKAPYTVESHSLRALDLEPGSEDVLAYASALADQLHANLIVLHAVPPIEETALWLPSHLPAALSEDQANDKLQRLFRK